MLKVNLHKSALCLSTICVICERSFVTDKVEAILWEDNKRIGNVCKECINEPYGIIINSAFSPMIWLSHNL